MKDLGKGDKSKMGAAIDDGLAYNEGFANDTKLRGETNLESQRPTAKTESVKSDRGSFKNKC